MKTYPATQAKLKVDAPQDPDAIVEYGFKYKPEVWAANTVYEEDRNLLRPATHNGYEYQVISNGTSGSSVPVFPTVKDKTVVDGTVFLKAANYNSFLRPEETLVAGTSWSATKGVPLTEVTFTAEGDSRVKVGPIPAGVRSFELTNRVVSSSGSVDDRTLVISVKER